MLINFRILSMVCSLFFLCRTDAIEIAERTEWSTIEFREVTRNWKYYTASGALFATHMVFNYKWTNWCSRYPDFTRLIMSGAFTAFNVYLGAQQVGGACILGRMTVLLLNGVENIHAVMWLFNKSN